MAISTEKLKEYENFKIEFTPPPPAEPIEESEDPFSVSGDGSINLDLSGTLNVKKNAKFESNVTIDGDLVVQNVNILEELESLASQIGSINSQISSINSAISSLQS